MLLQTTVGERREARNKLIVKVLVSTLVITILLYIPILKNSERALGRSQSQPMLMSQVTTADPGAAIAVPLVARQVTVRIFAAAATGSGAIVRRREKTYTVLTCAHIVGEDDRLTILTADGQKHVSKRVRSPKLSGSDLALVEFTSKKAYQVVAIADAKVVAVGDSIYAAGFPNWQWTSADAVEDTRTWGVKALRVTDGQVAMLPKKSLQEGYQLGYTNEIDPGMSGGPVLDRKGQLVGINGRLKYPPQGIGAFTFTDGSAPSEQMYQQMEALSWAIPATTFWQALK